MRALKTFEEYEQEGILRKNKPDVERAKSLLEESQRKLKLLEKSMKLNPVDDENANDYVEYCYNIIMFKIRAVLLKKGFNSSSHEAEVAFTRKIGFLENETRFLDQLRYFRNGILYYGKRFDKEYAEKVIRFLRKVNTRL